MKILLISRPDSSHTLKIANSLCENGVDLMVCGIGNNSLNHLYHKTIVLENVNVSPAVIGSTDGSFRKLTYLSIIPKLKKIIKQFKPDIVHSHYASSHGLIGYLLNFHPFVISVWGGDVYDFPRKNPINRFILKMVLNSADLILSTSKIMAQESRLYTNKQIEVIPFGVDTEKFKPIIYKKNNENEITIGIVKPLERYYGIDNLIKTFKVLTDRLKHYNLKLLIVGDGSLRSEFEKLVTLNQLNDKVTFTGRIDYSVIEQYHNIIDVGCYLSVEESFGVSIIESLACEVPVVASSVGGIPELVIDGVTGFLVPPENIDRASNVLEKLIINNRLRKNFGVNGRQFVIKNYEWSECLNSMINSYSSLISYDNNSKLRL